MRRASGGGPPSWTAAFADALARIADRDPRVVALTAAMPDGTGLDRFAERHPDRMYDVGIAEQHAVTFAAGLASEGLRPVCAIYSSFLQRGFDQIVHDVALQRLPVTFALDRAGLVGADGPTHHGAFDFAYLRLIPNLVVAAPRDENELQHLLATAIESGAPFALRFPRGAATGLRARSRPEAAADRARRAAARRQRPRDRGDRQDGAAALAAASALARAGISAAVVDARFAKPLDAPLLCALARQLGIVVTVEDHALAGGFGSAVLEALAERAPGARVVRLGLPDRFLDHAEQDAQWREAGIDAEAIAAAVARWLARAAARASVRRRRRGGRACERARRRRRPCSPRTRTARRSRAAAARASSRRSGCSRASSGARCTRSTRSAAWSTTSPTTPRCAATARCCSSAGTRSSSTPTAGKARHPVGIALGDAVHRFELPEQCFLDLLAGIEADLRGGEFETFAELEHYCYCVASTIGMLLVRRARPARRARARLRRGTSASRCSSPTCCATSARTPRRAASTSRARTARLRRDE